MYDLAERLYLSHQLGFPNTVATANSPELLMNPLLQYLDVYQPALIDYFESAELHQQVINAGKHLVSLFTIGQHREMATDADGHFLSSEEIRPQVSSVQDLPGAKLSLPKWVQIPEYQTFLGESSDTISQLVQAVDQSLREIERLRGGPGADAMSDCREWEARKRFSCLRVIIQEGLHIASEKAESLLPTELERQDWASRMQEQIAAREVGLESEIEFGDQRAKDIIDLSYEEPDPRRAIKLLRRALEYGDTGIQAAKAYGELGQRYEDLGDTAQAIGYYTRAVKIGGPDPYIFFWRGQLYHRLRRWREARHDLERALALEHFWSPERELAQRYLAEIEQALEQ